MTLNISVSVPGLIKLSYPLSGQIISSHAKLAGALRIPAPKDLPGGVAYIKKQIDVSLHGSVLASHQLKGKQYFLSTVTYYVDGNAFREVDYTADEIAVYTFNQDYLPTIIANDELSPGPHRFSIVVRAYSLQNPGVEVYDVLDLPFRFDATPVTVKPVIDRITPGQIAGEVDVQIINAMMDYVLTQRTEGAIKNDIDFLANLYDIEKVPSELLPYLGKTIGYDYFAGLLGDGSALREELRFLPEWQKSAGTAESMLMLLRPLGLHGSIVPLYLDLVNHLLVKGIKQRYKYCESFKVKATAKSARFTFPLTHPAFVPNTVKITITAGELEVFSALWDVVADKAVVTLFHDGTGSPSVQWLELGNGSHATGANVDRIFADNERKGITIVFDQLVKAKVNLTVDACYQYEVDSRPRRNTRLSEFFDCVITSDGKPNIFEAVDYLHVFDIIKRSKPLRTKLRQITFPAKSADAYHVNPYSLSSTGNLSNVDRITAQNIDRQAVQLNNPVRESMGLSQFNRVLDGFSFTWENACDRWENRFGIFHSLALETTVQDADTLREIANDTLLQRGYAAVVLDDSTTKAKANRERWLRKLGLRIDNAKGTNRCRILNDHTVHYYTLKHETASSPAVQEYRDLIMEVDDPGLTSPPSALVFNFDLLTNNSQRNGFGIAWDGGSNIQIADFDAAAVINTTWDTDQPNHKAKTVADTWGSAVLSLYRFPTQADLDAFLFTRPTLVNIEFKIDPGVWYAVWDVTADFLATPVHLSILYDFVYANFQDDDCCPDLAAVDGTSPSASFNQLFGTAYNNTNVEVNVVNVQTEETVAVYQWNGAYWVKVKEHPNLTVSLNPAVGGTSWTLPLSVSGTIQYIGPVGPTMTFADPPFDEAEYDLVMFNDNDSLPQGASTTYEFVLRACSVKAGDNMIVTTTIREEDDYAASNAHNGEFDVVNDEVTYLGGLKLRDLYEHKHNQGGIRQAAAEVYLRSDAIFPSLRMTEIPPMPHSALVYDSDSYDANEFYDSAPATQQYVQYLHFPKRVVVQTVNTFALASAAFIGADP